MLEIVYRSKTDRQTKHILILTWDDCAGRSTTYTTVFKIMASYDSPLI
nr:hypothetical protein [Mycoplasmopsis bovis]